MTIEGYVLVKKMVQKDKIKIINVTGSGRSGSTILGNVLGQINGFFFGGEVCNLWSQSLAGNRLCGCNIPSKECEVWKSIFNEAFGGMDKIDVKHMRQMMRRGIRTRYIPLLFMPGGKELLKSKVGLFLDNLEKLYLAIKKVTNSNVIVDCSKHSGYGYMLSLIPEVDLYIIHLVRDPRAVTFSWLKKKIQPDKDETLYMSQYGPFKSCLQWNIRNVLAETFWEKNKSKYIRVRYEDFTNNPKNVIQSIVSMVNEVPPSLPFVDEHKVKLGINHGVWGNPSRFRSGIVELQKDEEWKEKMKKGDKIISTIYTWPLLLKYEYSVKN